MFLCAAAAALDETRVRFYYIFLSFFFCALHLFAHLLPLTRFNYAKLTMSCGDCDKNEITFWLKTTTTKMAGEASAIFILFYFFYRKNDNYIFLPCSIWPLSHLCDSKAISIKMQLSEFSEKKGKGKIFEFLKHCSRFPCHWIRCGSSHQK